MLRQIRLKNFVKFNGSHEHRLDFPENGVYIFLGENNTGKSCIFEGVRRCMQTELNASISARYNPDNISYVICLFEKAKSDMLTSCFISFKEVKDTVFCKIIFYKDEDGNIITRSVRRKMEGGWGEFHECTLSNDKDKFHILGSQLLDVNNKHEIDSTDFIKFFKTHKSDTNAIDVFDQSFEQIEFETIFAYRGINPIQTSRQIPIKEGQDRYKSANDLAFVIKTYLEDLRDLSKVQQSDIESEYFRFLTEPESYTFQLKDGDNASIGSINKPQIVVTNEKNENPFPLLKTPEGIIEAKVMSITLSRRDTTTLLIEEPGRGMHPSMIDRLRDLVLYDISTKQKKTIIFTSHNHRFICPWTFEKIFYFYSSESGSEVISLRHALSDKKLKSKEYLCSDQVSPLFFSKRVIIVEGPDDKRFLGTLKNILLTDESRRRLVCGGNSQSEHTLRKFLTSLHIISMGGTGNAKEIEPLCSALKLTDRQLRYYLFDSDALLTIKDFVMPNLLKKDIEGYKLDEMEKNGVFVWFAYTETIVDTFETNNITDFNKHLNSYGRMEEALRQFYQTHDRKHHGSDEQCEIKNCTGLEEFLNEKHLDTNITKRKIWNSNDITDMDMREIVERIIDISMTYGDDCKYKDEINFTCPFKHLLLFLIKHAERSYQ